MTLLLDNYFHGSETLKDKMKYFLLDEGLLLTLSLSQPQTLWFWVGNCSEVSHHLVSGVMKRGKGPFTGSTTDALIARGWNSYCLCSGANTASETGESEDSTIEGLIPREWFVPPVQSGKHRLRNRFSAGSTTDAQIQETGSRAVCTIEQIQPQSMGLTFLYLNLKIF